jgi:glutamate racemase
MRDRPIGVFDSGVGGLTVLREIHARLPLENTVYLGDTARVPYGIRSAETIMRYSLGNTRFLIEKGIKILVIACNTVSAISLDAIREIVDIPVVGVIEPGARAAVEGFSGRKIGVIGTAATINSGAYSKAIQRLDSSAQVFELACPLFVPLVEVGWLDDPITEEVARRYLGVFESDAIESLVLGCTHYPLLKNVIQRVVAPGVTLIDSAVETARTVQLTLENLDLVRGFNEAHRPDASRKYFVTDTPERFLAVGSNFMLKPLDDVEKIDIMSLETAT